MANPRNWMRRQLGLPDLPEPKPTAVLGATTQPIVVSPDELKKIEHAEWRIAAIRQYVKAAPTITEQKKLEFRTECRELTARLIKIERMTEAEAEVIFAELK